MGYLLLKLWIYFTGIKFFKSDTEPKTESLRTATFKTLSNKVITFNFYKEIAEDIIFKRGQIYKEEFHYYLIIAKFDEGSFENLKQYNHLKYAFRSNGIWGIDESKISEILLSIYLDFVRFEITEHKKKKIK